ncbi:hypothetical protein ACTL6U_21165 [Rhodovibrionaceae bacterium A322]
MTVKVEWTAGHLPRGVSPTLALSETARTLEAAAQQVELQLQRLDQASQSSQTALAAFQLSLQSLDQTLLSAQQGLSGVEAGLQAQEKQLARTESGQQKLAASQQALSVSQARGDRQLAASQAAWKRYQDQVDQLRFEPLRNGLEDLQTTLTDNFQEALRGNLKDWNDWADAGRDILTRFVADMASQQIILPAVAGLGGAFGLTAGQMGLPVPPGASPSISPSSALSLAGQGLDVFGVDIFGSVGGWLDGLFSTAATPATVNSITSAGTIGAFTSEAALAGSGISALGGAGITSAGTIGAFTSEAALAGSAASAAGAGGAGIMGAIGSALPYVGLALAAAAILGPMLMGEDKDYPFGQVGFRSGAFMPGEVDALDGGDTTELEKAARSVGEALESTSTALGIDLTGIQSSFGFTQGDRGGALGDGFYSIVGGPGGFNADPETVRQFGGDSEAAIADFFVRNLQAGLDSAQTEVSDNVATALEHIVVEAGDTLADVLARLDFAETFDSALEALHRGSIDLTATIQGQVSASLDQAVADIQAFKETTEELGLDLEAAEDATAAYAAQLLGIEEAADPESLLPVQTAWRTLNATLGEAGPLLEETGLALEDLERSVEDAKTTLQETFIGDLQLGAAGLDGSLAAILKERDALRDAAGEIGMLGEAAGYIEDITDTALADYLADLNESQLALLASLTEDQQALDAIDVALGNLGDNSEEVALQLELATRNAESFTSSLKAAAGNLRSALTGLALGDLSPASTAEQLALAEGIYDQALTAYNRTGSGEDLENLTAASQDYLALAAAYYTTASQPYFDIFSDVIDTLEGAEQDASRQVSELEQILGVDQEQLLVLSDIREALRQAQQATEAARDWGKNPAVNKLLASATGYGGDFGGGGWADWIRLQDQGLKLQAGDILTDAGQDHRLGFLEDLPAARFKAPGPQLATVNGELVSAVMRNSEIAADGFAELRAEQRETNREMKALREENRELRQELRRIEQRRVG